MNGCEVCNDTGMVDGNQCRVCPRFVGIKCDLPPEGWSCSRGRGHEGPCNARFVGTQAQREAQFHDTIKPWLNKKQQGVVMGVLRRIWHTPPMEPRDAQPQRDESWLDAVHGTPAPKVSHRVGYVSAAASVWNYDMAACPVGEKCMLLNMGGVATFGPLVENSRKYFMAWAALPKRDKEEEARRGYL